MLAGAVLGIAVLPGFGVAVFPTVGAVIGTVIGNTRLGSPTAGMR